MQLQFIDWLIVLASLFIFFIMGMATLGWISGCLVIWSSLFAIGSFLYGRTPTAWSLTGLFVVSSLVLLYVINHLWDRNARRGEPARGSA